MIVTSPAIILKAFVDIVSSQFGQDGVTPLFPVIQAKPDAYILNNFRVDLYPKLFVWRERDSLRDGPIAASAELPITLKMTILQSSTDLESIAVGGGTDKSIYDLEDEVKQHLLKNQTLNKTVTGLWLPMDSVDFSLSVMKNQVLAVVGTQTLLNYRVQNVHWNGPRNELG